MNKFYVRLSYAWQLSQGIFHSLVPGSRIPQFILDTQHAWLKDNQKWLERLRDPRAALCDLDSRFRPGNGVVPADLFSKFEIDNNKCGVDRRGWENADARLKEILGCPAALEDVQEMTVEIWVHHTEPSSILLYESTTLPPSLPELFIKTFHSMPNLASLKWDTFDQGNDAFCEAFFNAQLELHTVKHLKPAQAMECLVTFCPNLEWLEARRYRLEHEGRYVDYAMQLIESASNVKNLTRFSMQRDWTVQHVETAYRTMPNISILEIGDVTATLRYGPSDDPGDDTLEAYVNVLSLFSKLKHLSLPSLWKLYVDFNSISGDGNFDFDDMEFGWETIFQEAEKVEKAAWLVLSKLPGLEGLEFGCRRANLTRGEDGQLNATWPWTGRMEEWAYEYSPCGYTMFD